tara:strand:- start:599 stop:1612 length:1014 start_codon:yes stop_codon:yes gene_type:complete
MKSIEKNIINSILYRFPNSEINNVIIYNNTNTTNKILYNINSKYFILKPKGKKAFLWFTYIEKKLLSILILINNNNIKDTSNEFYNYDINFDNTLCYNNVLLYGYFFINNNKKFFVIENVYNYNLYNYIIHDKNFNNNFYNKLHLFSKVVKLIAAINNNNNIYLPIILDNVDNLFKTVYNIDYNLYGITVYSNNKYLGNYPINSTNKYSKILGTFKVTACITQDLYNLYILDNNVESYYNLALIDSYKTSIYMNNLFRKIKENKNLDLLEESDNDDEFENINSDKFIFSNKSYLIECQYNIKFKKWVPIKLSKNNIISKKELSLLILGKKNIMLKYK